MKAIKFFSMMLCLMASTGFVSCSDDDGDAKEPPLDEEEEILPGGEPDEPIYGHYVLQSITEIDSNLGITLEQFSNPKYGVEYMRGQYMTILESYEPNGSLTYSLPESILWGDSKYELDEYTGYITSSQYGRHETHDYEYDSKGRLTTEIVKYGSEKWEETFVYDNRFNIVEYRYSHNGEELYKTEIKYTTIPAKTIPLQSFTLGGISNPFPKWVLTEAGFFGNSIPMCLVSNIVITDLSDGSETEIEYGYTLNRMGYVVEMKEKKYTTSKTYIYTWQFEWKEVNRPSYTNWLFSDESSPYYRYLPNLN